MAMDVREIRHFHVCCGIGGGVKGFNRGSARVGNMVAAPRFIGGVDVDPTALASLEKVAGAKGTLLDLFDRQQYAAFHGHEPPSGWREATGEDFRRAAGGERPHVVFMSTPCKGNSGLISTKTSEAPKYIALNELALRAVFLTMEAWADDPPEILLFENVPRIATRSRRLLDRIGGMLRHYGYAVAETAHDCGEIGGLAQSRKRFLLVARHMAKVPPFLYEPPKRKLLSVGEVLERLPLPGDPLGGPMHRVPRLQWKTWVRLAFVEAGSDWRSLNRLNVADGVLTDYGIIPEGRWQDGVLGVLPWEVPAGTITGSAEATTGRFSVADPREFGARHNGILGVNAWDEASGTVTGNARPMTGSFSVADPRMREGHADYQQYGVRRWGESTGSVINVKAPGQGGFSVADPRYGEKPRFNNVYRVVDLREPAPTVTAGQGPTSGGMAVADPRAPAGSHASKYRVTSYGEAAGTVIGASTTGQGAFALADPRTGFGPNSHRNKMKVCGWDDSSPVVTGSDRVGSGALSVADPRPDAFRDGRESYVTGGHFGVLGWGETSGAVIGHPKNNNGCWSVADPRPAMGDEAEELPAANQQLVAVIRAMDGTWHRPFTTLELAALQSLVDFDQPALELAGSSDSLWREHIGNMVPPDAATAMMGVIARTLLLAWSGESFVMSCDPVWVQPITIALAVDTSSQVLE
ncbi:DNA cytosine methyltransferase [Azospirillum picis]|uniref:Site-specific DNA-cytosine methylase n=1 Tax=Azospirillum picis TaxID=488438 RepID=A0ABU0MRU5_9PROT|nr:DNA cytosine methyltransferase [Azospirillum picis]MBP2302556.1 site-specific DNA-cytosine methylase [Azospirillum picis]MDQ0536202.1 site-specific DNA-cytosine methylase [Azospirillum picis]